MYGAVCAYYRASGGVGRRASSDAFWCDRPKTDQKVAAAGEEGRKGVRRGRESESETDIGSGLKEGDSTKNDVEKTKT